MPITRIYISSTYEDLKPYRSAVASYLRKLNKQVICMEDYVASDTRPLAKCVQDVDRSDAYVGIVAHRYGYIPEKDNPDSLSITELEYRQALKSDKPTLIFLLSDDAPWLPKFMDTFTGEAGAGKRIKALRAELSKEKLASFFTSELELASLVNAAVTNLESTRSGSPAAASSRSGPENRQITSDLFITFATADKLLAAKLAQEFVPDPGGMSALLAESDLFAATEDALLQLDLRLQTCDVAAALLSKQALGQMEGQRKSVELALEMIRTRSGALVALCADAESVANAHAWPFTERIDLSGYPDVDVALITEAKKQLTAHRTVAKSPIIGVPLVIAAMNESEATKLCNDTNLILYEMGGRALDKFRQIRAALPQPLSGRYGPTREQWRSPGSRSTVAALSEETLQRLARVSNSKLRGRAVKLQLYPLDPLVNKVDQLREVYRQMADHGCIMLVDELSLFHPDVRRAVTGSPMVSARNTAILTVSPFDNEVQPPQQILRDELKAELAGIFDRFATDFDPQCELGVSDECRLRRWLHQSLPETLQTLRTPRVEPAQVAMFAKELQADENGAELPGIV
jgi:hypothetical protein